RGPVVNLGLFLHFRRALGGPAQITPEVWGLCAFVLALAVVIALFKDIPDIVGDRQYRVLTFAVRFGRETIFRLSQAILVLSYLSLTLAAALWMPGVHVEVLAAAHLGALAWALVQGRGLTQRAPEALLRLQYREYYRTIWRLFYLEYLAFPVACALSR
ncbi:MAG TPA: UbiA family prenyltransferase, partial [Myxococcaceae bacterium]|nr:UbiA family prenyltransferase [Myxococcaceae bacterium]